MPLAAFIIIILGGLAATLARVTQQTDVSTVQEGISAQAFYAAESGAQIAMNRLFYFTDISRSSVNSRCTALNGNSVAFSPVGLRNCSADVFCSSNSDAGNTTSYYSVRSIGRCGSGSVSAERTVDLSAYVSDGV